MTAATAPAVDTGRRNGLIWVAVVGALQVATTSFGIGPPLQPLLSIVFVLTCPGFLLLDLDRPKDFSARLLLGIGGSVGINIAIATVVLVAEARWLAPALALALVGVAALPKGRLRRAVSKLSSIVGAQPKPQLALPAGDPTPGILPVGGAEADSGETQVGEEVAFGDLPEVATLEVPVLDEDSEAPALIDLNVADVATMTLLPGVGPTLAQRIVAFRNDNGPFETFDELLEVPGIGPSKLSAFPAVAHLTQPVADAATREPHDTEPDAEVADEVVADTEEAEVVEVDEVEAMVPVVAAPPEEAVVADADVVEVEVEPEEAAGPADAVDGVEPASEVEPVEVESVEVVVATPAPTDDRLDINTARLDQLVRLPGVGADLAVKIFTYRAGHGPFASTADLGAVSGVGAAKLRKLEELVFVPSALEPAEESPVAEAVEPEVEDTPAEGVVDAAADDAANVAEAAPVGAVEAAVDVMAIDGEPIEPDEGDVAAGSAVVDEIPPIDASGDAREPDSEVPSPEDAVDEVAIDGEPIERDEGDVAAGSAVVAEIEDAGVVDGVDDGVAGATLVDASAADAEVIVETPPIDASGDAREPDSEVPSPEGAAERGERPPVDINWADATQLISVPGIGPQLAERILSYRDQHGFFTTIDGLANVRGVSSSTVDRLRRYITV